MNTLELEKLNQSIKSLGNWFKTEFNESDHPRVGAGQSNGGQFTSGEDSGDTDGKESGQTEQTTTVNAWPKDFPNVTSLTTISNMKNHPAYAAAKGGDVDAAFELTRDLLGGKEQQRKIKELGQRYPGAAVVPVHAEERSGRNKIPEVLADYVADVAGLEADTEIVQSEKVGRTGSDAIYRLAFRPKFDGQVKKGQEYILVDDVVTGGGTLSELRYYIESKGGKVVHMMTAGAAQFSTNIALSDQTRLALEQKHGIIELRKFLKENNLYGGNHQALTESEARTLLAARSLDSARDRITAAKQESRS